MAILWSCVTRTEADSLFECLAIPAAVANNKQLIKNHFIEHHPPLPPVISETHAV